MFLAAQIVVPVVAGAPNGGVGEGNVGVVKRAYSRGKSYPYVSAQAYRRWLRDTMVSMGEDASPVLRSGSGKAQQAYTDADPARYSDDDLFGYMRAVSKKDDASGTTIRDSVLLLGTLMSVEPVRRQTDWGTMTRGMGSEDNPLIHEHEFYTADLTAPLLLDMAMVGTFTLPSKDKGGRPNYVTESKTVANALSLGAEQVIFRGQDAIRLPLEERRRRVALLLRALADVSGGAKNALHYGDRSPAVFLGAVMRGGINPFGHVVGVDDNGATVDEKALRTEVEVYGDLIHEGPFVGWRPGFRSDISKYFETETEHPRSLLRRLADNVENGLRDEWLED